MANKNNIVTVRLSDEQLAFLKEWQQRIEQQMEIEVPLGAVIRRVIDGFIRHSQSRPVRPTEEQQDIKLREEKLKQIKEFVDDYNHSKE